MIMAEFPVFYYPLDIREHHLDSFGHVNNVAYLQFFEQARWEVITSAGFGLERILAEGVGPVVLDLSVRFRRELKCRQAVTVKSQVKESRGRIWVLRQWIEDPSGEVYSEASFTMGLMDLKQRKLVGLAPGWAEAVGAIVLGTD
jgi:YbgC/YbaW family acyl-CoA thioester hydrolase